MEVGAILEGNVIDITPQTGLDFGQPATASADLVFQQVQPNFEGFDDTQPELRAATPTAAPGSAAALHDRLGQLRISKLRQHFARVAVVEAIAEQRRFMHWELCFADVLLGAPPGAGAQAALRGGGFDLILGHPPWL